MESYTLVITEKPDAARKVASALGPVNRSSKSNFLEIPKAFDGRSYIVCAAAGHLYEVIDPERNRSVFPVFDVGWFPKVASRKSNFRLHKQIAGRLEAIAEASTKASRIINACDYDTEGETIGYNIIQFACVNRQNIFRATFSTLVESDIRSAFASVQPHTPTVASMGKIRHEVDFLWGVNLSRTLTRSATRENGSFTNITIGRVQGPTLAFLVQRELDNLTHVPMPFWSIESYLRKNELAISAKYTRSPILSEQEAELIFKAVSHAGTALVTSIQSYYSRLPPRYPFNLGELQREAYQFFHFSPSASLRLAERLYLKALISYPRTDSQKLPASIGPRKILQSLSRNLKYSDLLNSLLSESLLRKVPWQGPREDPAHPAIYPTGEDPGSNLQEDEKKLYDLIVRRFCNTFAPDAIMEKTKICLDIASYEFSSEKERLVEDGWTKYYPFRRQSDQTASLSIAKGDFLIVENATNQLSYTRPPTRYSEGTLLVKMESEGLGTKATRGEVISTLVDRGYVRITSSIVPSERAMNLILELRECCPEITSPELTRSLERNLASLWNCSGTEESILIESLSAIRLSLRRLRSIGRLNWQTSSIGTVQTRKLLGQCPNCQGGGLYAVRSFKTRKRFIRCSKCSSSSPLPPRGTIRSIQSECSSCHWPLLSISFRYGKGPKSMCSNYYCKVANAQRKGKER